MQLINISFLILGDFTTYNLKFLEGYDTNSTGKQYVFQVKKK